MTTQFMLSIEKFVKDAGDKAELAIKKTVNDLFHRVVIKTPVDTGAARANWLASVGVFQAPVPNPLKVDPEANKTPIEIATVIATYTLNMQNLYLANNLPYIERLENGWSSQAPNGMVATSLVEFPQIITEAVNEVKKGE